MWEQNESKLRPKESKARPNETKMRPKSDLNQTKIGPKSDQNEGKMEAKLDQIKKAKWEQCEIKIKAFKSIVSLLNWVQNQNKSKPKSNHNL